MFSLSLFNYGFNVFNAFTKPIMRVFYLPFEYSFCRLDCVNHCLEKESISDEDQDEESAKSGGGGIHQDINDNLNLRSLSSGGSRVYQGRFDESFGTGSINCR